MKQTELLIPLDLLKRTDITQTEKILLTIFGTEICTMTVKELSEMIGLIPIAVTRALKNLENDGEIEVIKTRTEKNTLKYNYKRVV
jgi:DNA-binding MarR family transcriptional regulator